MERVRDGDSQAFARIMERYWSGTLLYASRLSGDPDMANDLAQEAFARLWRSRADWRGDGSVRIWLLRTTRRRFLNEQRKAKTRAEWAQRKKAQPASSEPPTPLQQVEREALRVAINEAVKNLSSRRREAFTLVHLQGLSHRDAAEIMKVRPQTVANYLQAALADLRVLLRSHFHSFG